jgi:glycosidase
MDNVYGNYASDSLTLTNLRAGLTGVQHRHDVLPRDPKPGEAVTIRVVTPGAAAFKQVALYYTTDNSTPSGSRGMAANGTTIYFERVHSEWDVSIWGYVIYWQATIPGQTDQTMVQYIISAWSENGEEIYADWPDVDDIVHHEVALHYKTIAAKTHLVHYAHFPGEHVFNYHVDTYQIPGWAAEATLYHIFIDRFYPGDGKIWVRTKAEGKVCGGTLWGVRDKLDYIAELGIDAIWLSPIWAMPSFHGYDVTNYDVTEPRLGGDEALKAVVDGAHERGIRVLLDMVCNHLSNEHPFFIEALNDKNSPFRDWFMFNERVMNSYKSFFGVASMPRINLDYPPARDWMVANAVYWLREFDVDGYRLDVADGPGPNIWTHFRKACRVVKPDCLIFGEIIDTPKRLRTYAGRLDGCLDFPLNDALRRTFGWETMSEVELDAFVADNAGYYPPDFILPAFLDNHDMDRFMYAAGNEPEKLKRAAAYLFKLPNLAIIYYGTEVGMPQPLSINQTGGYRASREPMVWGDRQNQDVLDFFKEQIKVRKQRRALASGG